MPSVTTPKVEKFLL